MTTPYLTPPVFSWPAAPGGKLHTYAAGGVLAQATYSDAAGVTPNTNPVTLDSLGSAVVRLAVGVAYHFVLKDATDVTTLWDADNFDNAYLSSGTLTAAIVGAALYPQTAAELAATVTPTSYAYPPGALRRYGADPLGVANSQPALLAACKCNSLVYDDYPGGGTYLLNAETVIPSFPITISGQARLVPGDSAVVNGTLFKLATVAGAGAATLRWSIAAFGVRISNIGFAFQTNTLGQIGIRFVLDCRFSTIDNCAFTGGGTGSQTTSIGIQLDGGGTYSGAVMIQNNYFSGGLLKGVWLKGSCVTVKMLGNEFGSYGALNGVQTLGAITGGTLYVTGTYVNVPLTGGSGTGAQAQITVAGGAVTTVVVTAAGNNYAITDTLSASNANLGGAGSGFAVPISVVGFQQGNGIQIDYPGVEQLILGNYFEGWTNGVLSNGGASIRQTANDYAVNTNAFVWQKTVGGYSYVKNQSVVDNYQSGGLAVYSQLDTDGNLVYGGLGDFAAGQNILTTRGYQEGNGVSVRTFAMGAPQIVTFSAGNFTASGSMTWTVIAGNVAYFAYSIVGKSLTVWVNIAASTAGGVASTALRITIPGGFSAAAAVQVPVTIENNGNFSSAGSATVALNGQVINVFTDANGATPWTLSANTGVSFAFTFPTT